MNLDGPLAGVPVSVKDTVNVTGYDSCMGYSSLINRPALKDAPIIRLLKDAGAIPFVKTNVPITLLSFESTNDVFGRTKNPHNPGFSAGGSTGGEAALLAHGGSRIGVGTDVAGSVRIPAAWSGCYAIRCTTGRFPRAGNVSSMPGQEGVPAVYSPMARTLKDLGWFLGVVVGMRPWEYDYTVHPIPWRWDAETGALEAAARGDAGKRVRWGVIRDDGVVAPTPAIRRALETVIEALRARGDEIVELDHTEIPSCAEALKIGGRLLTSDGGELFQSLFRSSWESNDAGVATLYTILRFSRFTKTLFSWWYRYVRKDALLADLYSNWDTPLKMPDQWRLVAKREALRQSWTDLRKTQSLDFILTPPNALPAVPEGGIKYTFANCGYTFLWNVVDWAAGVVPVGKVDAELDGVQDQSKEEGNRNGIEKAAWKLYDAEKMEGLPTAVQIVAGRWEEERCLWGMMRVEDSLREQGMSYQGNIEVEVQSFE